MPSGRPILLSERELVIALVREGKSDADVEAALPDLSRRSIENIRRDAGLRRPLGRRPRRSKHAIDESGGAIG